MISKKVFDVIAIMLISPLLMTMQMCSTTTTALALTRTNILSGFTFYMPVNPSKCPYYTNIQKVWRSYFLLVQIQVCNHLLILLELHHFTERERFSLSEFHKKEHQLQCCSKPSGNKSNRNYLCFRSSEKSTLAFYNI